MGGIPGKGNQLLSNEIISLEFLPWIRKNFKERGNLAFFCLGSWENFCDIRWENQSISKLIEDEIERFLLLHIRKWKCCMTPFACCGHSHWCLPAGWQCWLCSCVGEGNIHIPVSQWLCALLCSGPALPVGLSQQSWGAEVRINNVYQSLCPQQGFFSLTDAVVLFPNKFACGCVESP